MAKKESTFLNMVLTLLVVSGVASLSLGGIYNLTKGPIELSKKAKQESAIKQVIPDFEELKSSKILPENSSDSVDVFQGFNNGELVGVAVSSYTGLGYSGLVKVMVGFLPDGTIHNTAVLEQKETPGLGTKMAEPKFKDQFNGVNIKDLNGQTIKVKKDGGTIDAITAATISSRAFCDAVQRAYVSLQTSGGQE